MENLDVALDISKRIDDNGRIMVEERTKNELGITDYDIAYVGKNCHGEDTVTMSIINCEIPYSSNQGSILGFDMQSIWRNHR